MDTNVARQYNDIREEVGKKSQKRSKVINRRGNAVVVRKYHLTQEQIKKCQKRFEITIENVPEDIKKKAHPNFCNPYRQMGVYYAEIHALYLLGANEWHKYMDLQDKVCEYMDNIITKHEDPVTQENLTAWEKFFRRTSKTNSSFSKDIMGKIHDNLRLCQRLKGLHPYGLKLKQFCAAVNIKRDEKGMWYYQLATYDKEEKVVPIYDILNYKGKKRGRKVKKRYVIEKSPVG